MRKISGFRIIIVLIALNLVTSCTSDKSVQFIQNDHQIDIYLKGRFVTSYIYSEDLPKPVLYPVNSLSGTTISRGFPMNEVEGESRDHPHHAGIWFACGEVNGIEFWENVEPPPQIRHVQISDMECDREEGMLGVVLHWTGEDGKILLQENRSMTFYPDELHYGIDFKILLKAVDTTVTIHDTKEGLFAIRVADWLNEKDGTGRYLSSNGDETETRVWGKRAEWVRLAGDKDGQKYGVIIMNHPQSVNYPTFWMARGYGLFSANPIGQYIYQTYHKVPDAKPLNLTIERGESALFRFHLMVYEGEMNKEDIESIYDRYIER